MELSKRAGIAYQTAKSYTGKKAGRIPSVGHLIAIAKTLDVSLDVFKDCEDFQIDRGTKGEFQPPE
jgi:hypothetical protein